MVPSEAEPTKLLVQLFSDSWARFSWRDRFLLVSSSLAISRTFRICVLEEVSVKLLKHPASFWARLGSRDHFLLASFSIARYRAPLSSGLAALRSST